MITLKNGDQLRNLEEQVLKNKEDIARHYEIDRALANLGIKVIGQLNSAEDLPDPFTYSGEFGDAFAVGDKTEVDMGNATYTYYVFSRPDVNAGDVDPHWLDVGRISIVGPQGPQGIQGPVGPMGQATKWYTGQYTPDSANEGDLYLNNSGQVFQYSNGEWKSITIIKGPQGVQGVQGPQGIQGPIGPQGIQGQRGDVGGFINVAGQLTNESQLPTPASLGNLTIAYLVNNDLYIQIGSTSEEATWSNVGPLNVATLVTVGGEFQNTWDADTKVDKTDQTLVTADKNVIGAINEVKADANYLADTKLDKYTTVSSVGIISFYAVNPNGEQVMYYASPDYGGQNRVVVTASNGQIIQPYSPAASYNVANRGYVDQEANKCVKKVAADSSTRVYGVNSTGAGGAETTFIASQEASGDSVAVRASGGQLFVADPSDNGHAATKSYVDTTVDDTVTTAIGNASYYIHSISGTMTFSDNTTAEYNISVPMRTNTKFTNKASIMSHLRSMYGTGFLKPIFNGTIANKMMMVTGMMAISATGLMFYGLPVPGGSTYDLVVSNLTFSSYVVKAFM